MRAIRRACGYTSVLKVYDLGCLWLVGWLGWSLVLLGYRGVGVFVEGWHVSK